MTKAEQIYRETIYPFHIVFNGGDGETDEVVHADMTTEAASILLGNIELAPGFQAVEPVHPEFLGWTVAEIEEHLVHEPEPTPEEKAKKIFETELYNFNIVIERDDAPDIMRVTATTMDMADLAKHLEKLGKDYVEINTDSWEFLGWTVEEIVTSLADQARRLNEVNE